jgi:hypothetical protein
MVGIYGLFLGAFQVTTELREVPVEDLSSFMDEFNHLIFDMISSHDMNDRKGAILAIGNLLFHFNMSRCLRVLFNKVLVWLFNRVPDWRRRW